MDLMEKLVSLCKRRGFIFPSSEIYGGLNGCWDYGSLGVELKRNIKEAWWRDMVTGHDDLATLPGAPGPYAMVGLDCSILMNPRVWEASGHVAGFNDPMVDCKTCKVRLRADKVYFGGLASAPFQIGHAMPELVLSVEGDDQQDAWQLIEAKYAQLAAKKKARPGLALYHVRSALDVPDGWPRPCPNPKCNDANSLTEPRKFNLMFKTHAGAVEDTASIVYLRPETAQGIFVNFPNVCDTARVRPPFGIAQIGKAFRNEINPRNFTFRSREFEQMEIEFFCRAEEADQWYQFWRDRRFQWYIDLGIKSERLRLREHQADELAHYAKGCADVEYAFPFGVSELEGIANRTDFDLKQHIEYSKKDLRFFDDQIADPAARKYIPYVVEPSAGADRATLAFLCEAYCEDEIDGEPRTVMKLHPRIAPIKAAVFPLVKKDGMPEKAQEIYRSLKRRFTVFYDDKGAIGRRYRRQDEAGTPFCITIDGQTSADDTVTLRHRDTTEQVRIPVSGLADALAERLGT